MGSVVETMSHIKTHVRWGGMQVHHLDNHDESTLLTGDKLSANTKLHRLARSDDCLAARRIINNLDKITVKKLVESKNLSGSTPLHVAAYFGSKEMINLLLDQGGEPPESNKHGWTPHHYAARWSQPLNVKLAVGIKPCSPVSNSSKFSFKKIKDMRKVTTKEDTLEKRKRELASDSGLSVCGSLDSLK